MATAELAVGIMSVVVVLAMMLFAVGVGIAHVRTQEAARAGARAAARGDSPGAVRAVARSAMPGSKVSVSRGDERVKVKVVSAVKLPFFGARSLDVSSSSVAEVEPR